MCVQTVGLLGAAIERENITTVAISLLREVTSSLRPPRALFVPYKMGYPLGEANNPILQHNIIATGLALMTNNEVPVLAEL